MHTTDGTTPTSEAPCEALNPSPRDQPHAETELWRELRILCTHQIPATPKKPAHRCGSPALRGDSFCYFHHPTRLTVKNPTEHRARRSFHFPMPTTRAELKSSLGEIARRIAANQIDPRRASLLLYTLQNLAPTLPATANPTPRPGSGPGRAATDNWQLTTSNSTLTPPYTPGTSNNSSLAASAPPDGPEPHRASPAPAPSFPYRLLHPGAPQ
jgi:hypothetical protein